MANELDDLELALLRAITNWRLGPSTAGNRHDMGMAAIEKVHVERGGSTDDWFTLKRAMPGAMETLIVGGYLDEETGVTTERGRALLAR